MKEYVVDGKVVNITLEDGRVVKAMTSFLENMMKNLDIDMEEAVLTWLEDEEYLINDDQVELDTKAKDNKVLASLHRSQGLNPDKKKTQRERVIKSNPTKELIIAEIAKAVQEIEGITNINIENKGKIITFSLNGEDYKVDLVQKRKPKEAGK